MPRYSLSNDDSDDSDHDDMDDVEPPHPLGFGQTWIGLDVPAWLVSSSPGRSTYGLLDDDSDDEEEGQALTRHQEQRAIRHAYPPLSCYISKASTPSLLKYTPQKSSDEEKKQDEWTEDSDMELLQQMMQMNLQQQQPSLSVAPELKALPSFSDTTRKIQQKMLMERQRMEQEHAETTQDIKILCRELDKKAAAILQSQKKQQEEEEAAELLLKKQQEDEESRRQKKLEAVKKEEKKRQEEKLKAEAAASTPKASDYVQKAQKLVTQLVALRESIQPFDQNKAVSKRRLQMKKIVRGKINTLSENAAKIQQVAAEVSQAISENRSLDEQIKQSLKENKDPSLTPDMARGKRYLVDLLSSNTIQRVQADGFNGPRGDGFPLAHMLAMVSVDNKELVPVLAAHIYTVCPTAIPTLPSPAQNATEEELMSSLGMQKNKDGGYETFDRFLSRTEVRFTVGSEVVSSIPPVLSLSFSLCPQGIVSLVGNIMSSTPSTHVLLGGDKGAVDWLDRFLDLLPPPPTAPLPLLTAPVLHGFLSAAGHMLANKHGDAFQKHVQTITNEVLSRLDEGPIGKPSAIRLEKLMKGGFGKFQTTLPERALPELCLQKERR